MTENIIVSVCCNTYNHGKYIKSALESFVAQETDFRFEVIVHDDASLDSTADVVREYADKYPDIIIPVLEEKNQHSQGVDITGSIFFPRAKGKYIAFCEGDDFWCDNKKLQRQVDFLESHSDYSACVHNTKMINAADDSFVGLRNISKADYTLSMNDVLEWSNKCYQLSSLVMRREFFPRPECFVIREVGDYPRAIYLRHCGKIYYFSDVMSVYRANVEGSWTQRTVNNKSNERLKSYYRAKREMLLKIDPYMEYRHHDKITEIVRKLEVRLLEMDNNFKEIVEKYPDVYKTLTKKQQIGYKIGTVAPGFIGRCIKKYGNQR